MPDEAPVMTATRPVAESLLMVVLLARSGWADTHCAPDRGLLRGPVSTPQARRVRSAVVVLTAVYAGKGSAGQTELLGRLPAATGAPSFVACGSVPEPMQRLFGRRPVFRGG